MLVRSNPVLRPHPPTSCQSKPWPHSPHRASAHSRLTAAPAWESASSQAALGTAGQPCTQPGAQGRAVAGSGVGTQILAHR